MNPCNCDRCMKKTPSEGFYHASRAEHTRDAQARADLDYWMESKLGYDPKIGIRSLDNAFERQRTPQEFSNVIRFARTRYPRAFGKFVPGKLEREPIPYVESPPELVAERMAKLEAKLPDPIEP